MKFTFTDKKVNLPKSLHNYAEKKVGKLDRYFPTEASAAVVVIVSEETGSVSVAIGGMLKRHLKSDTLAALLRNELMPSEDSDEGKGVKKVIKRIKGKKNEGEN